LVGSDTVETSSIDRWQMGLILANRPEGRNARRARGQDSFFAP